MVPNVDNHLTHIDPDENLNFNNDACKYFTINEFNSFYCNDGDNYMLLNQNIQSFTSKQPTFDAFLESLCSKFNIITLTETWNTEKNIQLCKIDNFEAVHTHRNARIGGGVSVFANSSIYGITKIDELSRCNDFIETCVARVYRLDNIEQEHYIVGGDTI